MELIDTHCHLFMEPLGQQVDAVLERARAAGVTGVVVPAYDVASWDPVAGLAERPGVAVALGLHPWAADQPLELDRLESLLHRSGAVAVGEIGLDFAVDRVDRKRQIEALVQQLELARRLDLPVILHCRKAFEALIALVREHGPLRGVVHAFSRGAELAGRLVDELDLHLAFGGTITRRQALRPRHSASTVAGHRLLLETDAPSIGLDQVRPEETEPRHVAQVAAEVASLRGEALEALAEETTRNARALFALP